MATYVTQVAPHAGLAVDLSVVPAASGNIATTGDGAALLVYNGSASSVNVTVHITKTVDGVSVTGTRVTAVGASAHEVIPLPSDIGDASGQVTFDLSATASVGVAAFRIG